MKNTAYRSVCARGAVVLLMVATTLLFSSCKKDHNDTSVKKINFSGTLSPQAENPPVTSSGTGTVTATYDPATKTLQYTFTWSNLTGNAIAMHFHDGAPGVNGAVVIPVSGFPQQPSGTVTGTSDPLNDTLVTDLMAGKLYGNIHTPNYPGGEVRAQMIRQ
jgi:hypothetical protein